MADNLSTNGGLVTRVMKVKGDDFGQFDNIFGPNRLERWTLAQDDSTTLQSLQEAARHLRESSIPVGFPTETVYGLGADATRSEAVKGIYTAKGRPSDNPLIIHICDLQQLRNLLDPGNASMEWEKDPIPEIYRPLIQKFWPGPLTILLPNPSNSKLAPEVTAGLPTFGARMPSSPLALALIKLAGVPLAAPSANASTKPSPTTAQHVLYDLNGKIEIILDGGACSVGVESTVVDGLCDPPVVLRPGGLSIDSIRECEGWEGVVKGYKDASEIGKSAPRAPGMKYKHYSPKAKVVLMEAGDSATPRIAEADLPRGSCTVGVVRTKQWQEWCGLDKLSSSGSRFETEVAETPILTTASAAYKLQHGVFSGVNDGEVIERKIIEIHLGVETKAIAHGLFSALRELDSLGADIIFVEGIKDEGDIAAAVMNRLRKAATEIRS